MTSAPDGCLVGYSRLSPKIHRRLVLELDAANAYAVDPGHDLFTAAPSARAVLNDNLVWHALSRVLRSPRMLDPCRHVHTNDGLSPSEWHQDDYCGNPWPPGRWAMLCYFPQDTPMEMGPTQVLTRSGTEMTAAGPAGTFVVMDADLMHRALANTTGRNRYMLKFLFRSSRT